MKTGTIIFVLFLQAGFTFGQQNEQEPGSDIQEQVEDFMQANDEETEDDFYLQQLHYYRRHPLNLNEASSDDLQEFKILSELQIQSFISYRNLFGSFINIYELQAIPSWDISTIRKLIPYIIVSESKTLSQNVKERLFGGDKSLLIRYSMVVQKAKGFFKEDSAVNFYMGSRPHILVRYKYNFKNLLQYGLLGDKDAGEQFFQGAQKNGFDFYSFHLFTRKIGIIKSLAFGDFTVNLGQGLIHWQSLAFKKNTNIVTTKRQAEALRPYSSSGEYNFHRGAGITLGKKNWETTLFASARNLSATIKRDSILDEEGHISSLLNSGYHRSPLEISTRNNLQFLTLGSNIKYSVSKWHASLNWVQNIFSKPFKALDKPYDLFAIEGSKWSNVSFDYSYTLRNIHLFGEVAVDKNFNKAIIQGMITSLDRSVDFAMLFRKIEKQYHSLYGNALTENLLPSNEAGIYTGLSIRPAYGWKIDVYADIYKFPWLLFRANAPSYGYDYLLQLTFTPGKEVGISLRYKREAKQGFTNTDLSVSPIFFKPRGNIRYHLSYKLNREISINNRLEVIWYQEDLTKKQNGYLVFADLHYKPHSKPYSFNTRFQYFETDGYNARVYAYENDVLYAYNTPAFFEKGYRWYLNMKADFNRTNFFAKLFKFEMWIKYATTHYFELDKIGTELDEIQGRTRSEFKIQFLVSR